MLYAVLMASRKLQHYFQSQKVSMITSLPLKRILRDREATSRMVEWAIELGEFGLHFV